MRTGDLIGGRYRLEDELGSGSGGVVWSAFDTKLMRTVALKRPHSAHEGDERELFLREAQNTAQVRHPNAICVYEAVDAGECWLVMEYLPSRSLDRILASDGPLPPERAARIGMQIAAALHAAHAVGVVHRDVKPGNILVADDDLAKLTDFGISVWREVTLTGEGKVNGTPAYVAPEVAQGLPATTASDVFSLGATLFAAVEGAPPFGRGHPDAILARARGGLIPGMHRAGPLAPALSKMLDSHGKRPSADQAREHLQKIADGWEPPRQDPVRRHPVHTWVAAAAAIGRPAHGWATTAAAIGRPAYAWVAAAAAIGRPAHGWVAAAVAIVVAVLVVWSSLPHQGQESGVPPAPVAARGPSPIIADERRADPCALMGEPALRRFGRTELLPQYANFDRCDVHVQAGDGAPVDVVVELTTAETPRRVRAFEVERLPSGDGRCERRVSVSDKYDAWLSARADTAEADLCAMADVVTEHAVQRLRQGSLPDRRPFVPASLAHADACALVDRAALGRVPGLASAQPIVGFGSWSCRWNSTADQTSLFVLFEQPQPLTAADGRRTRLSGRDAFVLTDGYGERGCAVRVAYRPFTDLHGQARVEIVIVVVSGDRPGRTYCRAATDLAKAAAANLPG
ncbi:serine/threonine-protein kinase [Nonomuraea sp. NPDC046802]|uniref:serine/threonine-protein kinase n=1 Tax=Nonomuraea sp. NPDC046802 TaxID=3154919 RepID=UPI0033E8ACD1